MTEPLAYLNGRFLPAREAAIPVDDLGFTLGTTVTEQLRTFSGEIFRLDDHLRRFQHSLDVVGIDVGRSPAELAEAARELVEKNYKLVSEGDDLGLSVFATPGRSSNFNDGAGGQPLVCMHTYLLPFCQWAQKFELGETLVATSVQQTPAECWPRELKCRSRMHYYLADRAAAALIPGARAILLDAQGNVMEATTANLLAYFEGEGLISPPREQVLSGISLAVLTELAEQQQIPVKERSLTLSDLARADEVLLSSTPYCLLGVVQIDDAQISGGGPGPIFARLLSAFTDLTGVDIAAQARAFSVRK